MSADEDVVPPAPWLLRGQAICCVSLDEHAQNLSDAPDSVRLVRVGGRALRVLYLARYNEHATRSYNELIVASLVRVNWRMAAWISHIYVDLETSVRGGREIWGLPKVLARFEWTHTGVRVLQADQLLCHVQLGPARKITPVPLRTRFFSSIRTSLATTRVHGRARMSVARAEVHIGGELRDTSFQRCRRAYVLDELDAVIEAPRLLNASGKA